VTVRVDGAGIVAAARGNGIGGAGVAPGAQILPVRVLGPTGIGWSSDVAAGIVWAHQQGADVINLSLGATGNVPPDIDGAVNQVTTDRSRGKPPTVVVAAAGNGGPTGAPSWPGRHPRAIAVAATDAWDVIASYSTWGGYVSVSAPGSAVLSTCRNGDHCQMSGTSMATPMVAGAAAVLRQKMPAYGPDEVRARLEATAVDLGAPGRDPAHGAGRIDVRAAVGSPPPASAPAAVPLTGSIDRAVVNRRRWELAGSAVDPDAPPVVRIIDSVGGRWHVTDVAGSGGRWSAARDGAAAGTHTVCAVGIDQPSGQGVLLGCRQLVVK
jgi:subtilisin family serine protease